MVDGGVSPVFASFPGSRVHEPGNEATHVFPCFQSE